MPQLTGRESSVLAYLAEYPNAPDADEKISTLGADAREIALCLIGKHPNPSQKVRVTAQAIKNWADTKSEQINGIFSVRCCQTCGKPHLCPVKKT